MKNISNKNIESLLKKILSETLEERANELEAKLHEGENVCEQCGGETTEGICEQCSSMNESDEFDYVAEEEELGSDPLGYTERYCDKESSDYNAQSCKYFQERVNNGGEMNEKLYGNQDRLDHNKNGRIDSDDLRMARAKKGKKRSAYLESNYVHSNVRS